MLPLNSLFFVFNIKVFFLGVALTFFDLSKKFASLNSFPIEKIVPGLVASPSTFPSSHHYEKLFFFIPTTFLAWKILDSNFKEPYFDV